MTDAVLRNRLLATVPAFDDADWLDVRRRARAIGAPRRRNRRLLALAAVLAILTALVVNPALGIGERLLDFVEGDPAPEEVKQQLELQANPPPLRIGHRVIERPKPPPPDLAHAQLALRLDSSVGPVYLWAAPAGGGACTALEIEALPRLPNGLPNTSGGCSSGPSEEMPIRAVAGATRVEERYLNYIQGQVGSNVVRLEVRLSDGRVVDLRLVESFFLAELPTYTLAEKSRGCQPISAPMDPGENRPKADPTSVPCFVRVVEYRGFDANGTLVGRHRPRYLLSPPARTRPVEPFREAISIRLYSGREARIDYARAQRGTMCWRVFWGAQKAGTCSVVPKRLLPSAMTSGLGKNQTVLLQGPVGTEIARVDLVWDDETRERLPVENGFVLKQIDPYGRRFPTKLVGRDEAGRVVVERSAFGPG